MTPTTPEEREAIRARADRDAAWQVIQEAMAAGDGRPSEPVKALGTLAAQLARDVRRLLAEREGDDDGR